MKRCFSIILTIILLLSLLPAGTVCIVANAAAREEDFTYEIHHGQVTITGCVLEDCSYIDIPQFIGGYPVVCIGESAFQSCSGMLGVTIPEGVEVIEPYAFFECKNLRYLSLPDTLAAIGDQAFCGCSDLEELEFGSSLKTIGEGAFTNCDALPFSLDLPEGLESIGMGAFSHCSSLETVLLPSSLKDLGAKAFYLCSSLDYIYIPDTVEHLGEDVLYGTACYANSYYWYGDGFYIGLLLMDAKNTISGSYTPLKGIVRIADGAFSNCDSLTEVILWDGLQAIGSNAFYDCGSLASVTLPDSLRVIDSSAFEDCQKLQRISIPSGVTDIGDRAFYGCRAATVLQLPDSVVNLGQDVFTDTGYYNDAEHWDNNALCLGSYLIKCNASVSGVYEVPQGIKTIAYGAMKGLNRMTGVVLPDTLERIDTEAFADCTALKEVAFPSSVTSIGQKAFYNCSALQELELGQQVSQIGDSAFGACGNLDTIRVDSGNQTYSAQGNCLIHRQDQSLVMGCRSSQIPADGSVTGIGAFAFESCAGLTQITVPDTVLTIGTGAFQNCDDLITVRLGNGVQTVGELAFADCDSLTQIDLGQSVHTIADRGFAYNHGLTHVDFPASLRQLGEEAFSNGTGLVSIRFQEGIVSIGRNCFAFCENLSELQLPDSLRELKDGAFYACEKIAVLDLGEGVTGIGSAAFSGCERVVRVAIPDSVQTVGSSAFCDCTGLQQLDLGSVNQIGYSAFSGCKSLTDVHIPATVEQMGGSVFTDCPAIEQITVSPQNPWYHSSGNCLIRTDEYKLITGCKSSIIPADGSVRILDGYAFAGCSSLKHIVVPDAVTAIRQYTFYDCSGLESMELPFIGGELNYDNYIGYIFGGGPTQNDQYVPASLKQIIITGGAKADASAFSKCNGLQEIMLPESLSVIGYNAFERCPQLQRVIIPGVLEQIKGEEILYGSPNATLLLSIGQGTDAMAERLGLPYQLGGLITFLDEDSQCIDRIWYHQDEQIVPPEVPEKPADDENIYTVAWDPAPDRCTGNQTIRLCYIADTENDRCEHIRTELRNGVQATCTENGYTGDIFCVDCGAVVKAGETVVATGHSHTAVVTAPTCTASGCTTYTCNCGDSYVTDMVPALGHSMGDWTVLSHAYCTADGQQIRTCIRCDHTETETIPATGHRWDGTECTQCHETRENPFGDVPGDQWFANPVLWAVEQGITLGTSANAFSPNNPCTRAQIVTFLWRANGSPEPESVENPFTDVVESDYFCKAVLWAVENRITMGMSATTFGPNAVCTRGQVATFLWRSAGEPELENETQENPFTDVEETSYFYKPILWAVENGVTLGVGNGKFAPNTDCTRAQIVTFLYRALVEA